MFSTLRTLFRQIMNDSSTTNAVDTPTLNLAMASLLCEVTNADHEHDPREQQAKIQLLIKLLDISEPQALTLLTQAQEQSKDSVSLYEFTNKLRELTQPQRYQLIEAMWIVAYADGVIDPLEEAVIRQVSDLIYLDHSEFIRAKFNAQKSTS